jgi:hypothetical protein
MQLDMLAYKIFTFARQTKIWMTIQRKSDDAGREKTRPQWCKRAKEGNSSRTDGGCGCGSETLMCYRYVAGCR